MINSVNLRLTRLVIIIIFLTAIFGCTHYYTPKKYPLKPGMVERFTINQSVTIVNDQPNTDNKIIGAQNGHKWLGNLNQWTNTAVRLLKDEFKKRDITVKENSPKVLYLKINDANIYWGFFQIRCILYLTARTGDGYKNEFEGNNASGWTLYRAADGAVTRAVAAMLNDQKIRAYLEEVSVQVSEKEQEAMEKPFNKIPEQDLMSSDSILENTKIELNQGPELQKEQKNGGHDNNLKIPSE